MKDYKITKQSPFTPSTIVNPNDFVGREDIIRSILNLIPSVVDGNNRNFYLVGYRGWVILISILFSGFFRK